jgi:hypothetical protein
MTACTMDTNRDTAARFDVGGRLPSLSADEHVLWRPRYTRNAVVLAVLHDSACEPCARYARRLQEAISAFAAWDGQLVLALPDRADHEATVAGTSTVPDTFGGAPRIVVADRFGQIFHVEEGGPAHQLSEPRALEDWLRFLATQCPE